MKAVRRFGFILWGVVNRDHYWLFWRTQCSSDFFAL